MMNVSDSSVRDILDIIHPSRWKGQNFLINRSLINYEISLLNPQDKVVLEIGPGPGITTESLARYARKVIAVEIDRNICQYLSHKFKQRDNIEIIQGDVLEIELPEFELVFSNLPYVISSPMMERLAHTMFERGVIMFQKEFADRLVAKPGTRNYSHISLLASRYFSIRADRIVSPCNFVPRPKVMSRIVVIYRNDRCYEEDFMRFTRYFFSYKNKLVKSALRHVCDILSWSYNEILEIISESEARDFLERRVRELDHMNFEKLFHVIEDHGFRIIL